MARATRILLTAVGCIALGTAAQAAQSEAEKQRTEAELQKELSSGERSEADRKRDADRKPAQLMSFLGVQPGMTALDVIAAGGYMTEVLSVAVGPKGKVYSQNPPAVLRFREGAYDKELTQRLANDRLPNVVRVDAELSDADRIPAGSVDVAITALNFHDVYNRDPAAGEAFVKNVHDMLKPGGVFGVIDHVGVAGANNAQLHRVPKQAAIDAAKAAGFVVEAESDVLAHPQDDHTRNVFDPGLRGKTDQFVLRLRKPK